ncbi:hypothetical protein GGR52DRAFT_533319 [Hypoxylon sp. FL1284]|nr:hypothetical protein GGR52DRAFT_533319 [Hypoxylon sp. FL1284]
MMMSRSNTAQEEHKTGGWTTDNKSKIGEEDTDTDIDDEMKKWLSTVYERGSKKPMAEPLIASWGLPISDADVERLRVGFKSTSMDDKWDMLIEDPDENGNMSLHIVRNWLQEECYILHVVPKPSNNDGACAKIQGITWEGNKAGLQCDAERAKKEAIILTRGHLHCEFETLPRYPSSVFWDRNAYKKLDGE